MINGRTLLPLNDQIISLTVLIGGVGDRLLCACENEQYSEVMDLTIELCKLAEKLSAVLKTEKDHVTAQAMMRKVLAKIQSAENITISTLERHRRLDRNRPVYRKISSVWG